MERTVYRLDDSVIAQIVRVLQLGILTGTDISDHIRLMVVEPKPDKTGYLQLTPEYKLQDGQNIDALFDQLDELMEQDGKEPELKN